MADFRRFPDLARCLQLNWHRMQGHSDKAKGNDMNKYSEVLQRVFAGATALAITMTMLVSYYAVPSAQAASVVLA